jgi:hypothetical protein
MKATDSSIAFPKRTCRDTIRSAVAPEIGLSGWDLPRVTEAESCLPQHIQF